MILLALPAFALDFPWVCPTFATPVDAAPYRETDGGLEEAYLALEAVYGSFSTSGCTWDETTTVDLDTTTTIATCTLGDRTWTRTTAYRATWDGSVDETTTTRALTVASGEAWTALALTESTSTYVAYDGTTTDDTYAAAWTGDVVPRLPTDGWFTVSSATNASSGLHQRFQTVDTPGCALSWGLTNWAELSEEMVRAGDAHVLVSEWFDRDCRETLRVAEVDDVVAGAVDTTWAADPADADRDGYPVGACDCDDEDPTLHLRDGSTECDPVPDEDTAADTGAPDTAAPADTAEEPPAEDAPPARADGCGGGAAWLAFLPLLGLRRRRAPTGR